MADPQTFLDGRVTLYAGDCLEVLKTLPDTSIDSIVTDPPYGLEFMGKEWDAPWQVSSKSALFGDRDVATPGFGTTRNPNCRACGGRLRGAKKCSCATPDWDEAPEDTRLRQMRGFQDWCESWARECLRVLKPGGHMVAFSGTRTYHRMACAIEDAGFEIRDQIGFAFGAGFPKSHNVSKAIDKAAGADREVIGTARGKAGENLNKLARPDGNDAEDANGVGAYGQGAAQITVDIPVTAPATDAARQWDGWGTALKPAWEPICLARKPLIGTVVANVLAHCTGALNIDACRIETEENLNGGAYQANPSERHDGDENWRFKNGGRSTPPGDERTGAALGMFQPGKTAETGYVQPVGRWPANLIHDGSDEVLAAFPDAPGQQQDVDIDAPSNTGGIIYGKMNRHGEKSADARYTDRGSTNFAALPGMRRGDSGSAARFFYSAKADADDRLGSKHPTVKPLDLTRYLCRLITPPGGTVLDLFAGTGTTGEAAYLEGFLAILIEREAEYQADIARRMELVLNPTRRAAVAKSKNKLQGAEGTPLFGGEML